MTDLIKQKIDNQIIERIFKLYRQFRKESEKRLIKFRLNIIQAHCLFFISEKNKINYKELAEKLDVSLATVSSIIERLIKNRYIKRINSKTDRRVFYLVLTDKAEKILKEVRKDGCLNFKNILKNLSLKEKKQLIELMTKISSCLN